MSSKTCAQKGDYTCYGMYAKYVKENHEEMCGRKWETFNKAKVIFHQWEHVFAADQKTSLLAVLLDYLMHHGDAQACVKNTTRVLQTITEWGRQMASSLVSSQNKLGVYRVLAVFFGQDWRCCGYEHFKGKLLSFICVRVRRKLEHETPWTNEGTKKRKNERNNQRTHERR